MVFFNFATAQRIQFGSGRFAELGSLAAESGRRICLVTGLRSLEISGRLAAIREMFERAGLDWVHVRIEHEPTVEWVDEHARLAREFKAEALVAVGGGSVLDAGKAVAALLANGGETLDYLEGVGRGKPLGKPSLPLIAVPTTAGTGAEATKNAVITNAAKTFKKSMRAEGMLPHVALVDPELTADCPPAIAAACGMDALTQLIEAFTSRRANPMIDALAGLGLGLAGELPKLMANPGDDHAREALSMASLLGGISLANAGLGAVHGLASPLGAFYPIPHGVVCATLLPAVIRHNARKGERIGDSWLLTKYCAVAAQLVDVNDTGPENNEETLEDVLGACESCSEALAIALALSEYLRDLVVRLGIPGLAQYGVKPEDFPMIIDEARGGSMKTNPVDLDDVDLAEILAESL